MDEFLQDLSAEISSYYQKMVEILPQLALAVFFLLLFVFIAGRIRRWLLPKLLKRSEDDLLTGFLADVAYWLVLIVGISIALSTIGLDGAVTKLLAGAGLSAFILGFALKDIGENFLAGILLAFNRPYKIGDLVESQGVKGRIIDMNLRETIIKTLDGKDVFVPNGGILKNPLYNYSIDDFLRLEFSVEVDNREDHKKIVPVIERALRKTPGILDEPGHAPKVNIEETTSSTVCTQITFWIKSPASEEDAPSVKTEAVQNVMEALKASGFSYNSGE